MLDVPFFVCQSVSLCRRIISDVSAVCDVLNGSVG